MEFKQKQRTPLSNNQSQLVESPSKNWNPLFTSSVVDREGGTERDVKSRNGNLYYRTSGHQRTS